MKKILPSQQKLILERKKIIGELIFFLLWDLFDKRMFALSL
jgi:hypothetical protein